MAEKWVKEAAVEIQDTLDQWYEDAAVMGFRSHRPKPDELVPIIEAIIDKHGPPEKKMGKLVEIVQRFIVYEPELEAALNYLYQNTPPREAILQNMQTDYGTSDLKALMLEARAALVEYEKAGMTHIERVKAPEGQVAKASLEACRTIEQYLAWLADSNDPPEDWDWLDSAKRIFAHVRSALAERSLDTLSSDRNGEALLHTPGSSGEPPQSNQKDTDEPGTKEETK